MFWIFLVLLTHFFWALSNVGDKYILVHQFRAPYVYIIMQIACSIYALLLLPFVHIGEIPGQSLFLAIVGGVIFALAALPYARAIQLEEVTRINVWWSLQPIFGIFIGIFFGKYLAPAELIAIGILSVAAFLASLHAGRRVFHISKALGHMVLSTFLFALYAALLHEATQSAPFFDVYVVSTIAKGVLAWIALSIPKVRVKATQAMQHVSNKQVFWILFIFTFVFAQAGIFLNYWALSLQHASLVFAFEGSQALITFILAGALHKINPAWLQEEFDRKNLVFKAISVMCMILGILVLALR
jgi:drug/metabolite transporter (DMT)-like permease